MSSKAYQKQKLIQDKCQIILGNLLREEDNKYCVECDAKGPRWASWNLGVFLCIRCAGIHRNLGVHISKVKSVNLDSWTPEQVAGIQQMGNSQARAVYEAYLPESFRRPQTDSSLEAFIRAKYEQKKYIAKEWVPPPAPKPAFNVEDEKRKEKKKKSKVTALSQPVNRSVQRARPDTTGSVSCPIAPHQDTSKRVQQVPGSVDLLNLGDETAAAKDEDIFDVFLSAPMSTFPASTSMSTFLASTSMSTFPASTSMSTFPACTSMSTFPASTSMSIFPEGTAKSIFPEGTAKSIFQEGTSVSTFPEGTVTSTVNNLVDNSASKSNITDIEADFFNQKSDGNTNQPNKMTKESILSLYASNSNQVPPAPQQIVPSYGIPSANSMYAPHQPYAQVAMTGYSAMPATGINLVQQQMTNLQLSIPAWNVAENRLPVNVPVNSAPVGTGNLVIGSNQSSGVMWPPLNSPNQNLPQNLWQ